jgi:hypothetical protein
MAEQKITQCRIILYKTGPDSYSPALVTAVNEDGSVNLTVFLPSGNTVGAQNVAEGREIGDWAWPGIDAKKEDGKIDLGRHGATGPDDKIGKYQPSEEAHRHKS